MINYYKIKFECLVALVILAIFTSGCSVVGLGAGMVIDNSQSDQKTIEGWECGSIKKGTKATVYMKGGSQFEGTYAGLQNLPADEYIKAYNKFRNEKPNGITLPEMGDTLRIIDWKGNQGLHEFRGFGYRYKSLPRRLRENQGAVCQYLSAISIDRNEEKEFRLKYLEEVIDGNGDTLEGEMIEKLSVEGRIPLQTVMTISTLESRKLVNIENISSIEVPRKKYAKWVGLGLGLAVDAAIVAVAIAIARWEGPEIFGDSEWY